MIVKAFQVFSKKLRLLLRKCNKIFQNPSDMRHTFVLAK